MTEPLEKKPAPFCLRLSQEERTKLEQDAAGMPLGEYVRQRVFDESKPKRRTSGKLPVKDHQVLSQLLGELGRSRLANNLNQIAKAVHTGALVLSPETRAVLLEACADIRQVRQMVMEALGLEG